ncbi:MAG: hypothetical protein ACM3ZC_04695 [Bacteroidota bacterium]
MAIDAKLLEVREYTGDGYKPVVDFGAWRVALMRHAADLDPDKIVNMQRHDETDEVFVLLQGRCILFVGEGGETVAGIHAQDMEPFKVYNVKKGVWHTHVFSKDAVVLIVENADTTSANSPKTVLSESARKEIRTLTAALWV